MRIEFFLCSFFAFIGATIGLRDIPVSLLSLFRMRLGSRYLWYALLASYVFIGIGVAIQLRSGLDVVSLKSPIRYLYDSYDIGVYYRSSDWLGDLSRLYVDVPSEYPLAANIIFLGARMLSTLMPKSVDHVRGFQIVWSSMGLLAYGACLSIVSRLPDRNNIRMVTWLTPAVLYYSLFRFDIFVALPIILFMFLVKRNKLLLGSLSLGLAISLKGFAIVLIPALFYFSLSSQGLRVALKCMLIAFAPFFVFNLLIYLNSGYEGLMFAYRFHVDRTFNGESTWDAFGLQYLVENIHFLPAATVLLFSSYPIWKRPKSFAEFADCAVIAVVGFASSLVFYSPQFVLWIVSISIFSERRYLSALCLALSLVTYGYFPYAADLRSVIPGRLSWELWSSLVKMCAFIRVAILAVCVLPVRKEVSG